MIYKHKLIMFVIAPNLTVTMIAPNLKVTVYHFSGDGTLRKNVDLWRKWAPQNSNNLHRQ